MLYKRDYETGIVVFNYYSSIVDDDSNIFRRKSRYYFNSLLQLQQKSLTKICCRRVEYYEGTERYAAR